MTSSVDRTVKKAAKKASQYAPLYVTEHSVAHDFDFPDNPRQLSGGQDTGNAVLPNHR